MADFVDALTVEINEVLGQHGAFVVPERTAQMLTAAAVKTIQQAMAGQPVMDSLERKDAGTIMAALMWNSHPGVRQAIKPVQLTAQ